MRRRRAGLFRARVGALRCFHRRLAALRLRPHRSAPRFPLPQIRAAARVDDQRRGVEGLLFPPRRPARGPSPSSSPMAYSACGWSTCARHQSNPTAAAAVAILGTMAFVLIVEMAVIGSRILRDEVRNKTLVGLAALPFAMKHIVLMKMDGAKRAPSCPRSLWPRRRRLALGAVSDRPWNGAQDAWPWLGRWRSSSPISARQAWLISHVAAYFSLRLKWGALPLSFAICVLGKHFLAASCASAFSSRPSSP